MARQQKVEQAGGDCAVKAWVILDFRFWILDWCHRRSCPAILNRQGALLPTARRTSGQSKIENPKSKIVKRLQDSSGAA
jgi:hypothetical protein